MPIRVGEGVLDLSVDDSGLDKGLAAGEKKSASWLKKLAGGVAKTLAVGVAGAGAAVGGIGVTLGKLALDALPLEGISDAFKGITGDAGETMAALRKGSLGMVKDTELMASYNTAAGLVSKTFADELPGAMAYLSKVSAATGQDMGYMIDSLVKGVGRMSPMILDNLGIQVALSDAVARASEMFGVEADELTKTQQQAGMMAVVMEKLQENTAAMPEVTGTAAQMWASFRTTLANVKDQIGMELIPVFKPLIGVVGDLARDLLPKLIGFIRDRAIPGIRNFAGIVGEWGERFKTDVLPVLRDIWDWLRIKIPAAIRTASDYWENTLRPAVETVWGFLEENLEPVLAGLAAVLLGVVIPAIIAWATTMWTVTIPAIVATLVAAAPIILILAAIGAAVGLLVKAWQEDWGGIRTTLTAFWEEKAKPIFELIVHWFREVLPPALIALRDWFVTAWANITTTVSDAWIAAVAIFEKVKLWFTVTMPNALHDAWENIKATIADAIYAIWENLTNWYDSIKDAIVSPLNDAWQAIKDKISEWIQIGRDILEGLISGAKEKAQALIDSVLGPIKDAISRAKRLLGMSSPSRLFAEMGRGMMQGMALGVQQYAAMPAAATALATQQVISTVHHQYNLEYYGVHHTQASIRDIIRSLEIGSS